MTPTDKNIINTISCKLEKFSWKTPEIANFRCHICGDSEKKKSKKRGFFICKSNKVIYYCHNCHSSISLKSYLKEYHPEAYSQYIFDFTKTHQTTFVKNKKENDDVIQYFYPKLNADKIIDLPDNHYAKRYIKDRKIPLKFHSLLYYTSNYREFIKSYTKNYPNLLYEPRLIIPFFDENKKLTHIQGRFLDDKGIRYITCKINDDIKFYGLDRWNKNDITYVVEGPIDSMFLPNCIALAGSTVSDEQLKMLNKHKTVFIFDNEPRNKEIIRSMNNIIDKGYSIFIWPKEIYHKDINYCVCDGIDILKIINENVYNKISAKINLNKWKKI